MNIDDQPLPTTIDSADETLITEITIQPDGRVFVFGTSRQVLEVLESINPNDPRLNRLLAHVRAVEEQRCGAIGVQVVPLS
jgi:hypothetical protein